MYRLSFLNKTAFPSSLLLDIPDLKPFEVAPLYHFPGTLSRGTTGHEVIAAGNYEEASGGFSAAFVQTFIV